MPVDEASWPEFDVGELLRRLVAQGVDFVVVGGIAAIAHGSPRLTRDLDIAYAADQANLEALGAVLMGLDASLFGVTEEVPFVPDDRTLANVQLVTLTTLAGRLDVMTRPDGAPAYDVLRRRAVRQRIAGVTVLVASIDDLISMKRAAGRNKDLGDIDELEAIKRLAAAESAPE
jgi:hypothetical protein